jgi:hypothetical protein
MAYKFLGNQRITIALPVGAAVISLKELIVAGLTTNLTQLFNNSTTERDEYLRHIGSWVCAEGTLIHASPADTDVIYIMTDFRAKTSAGVGQYPSGANMAALGIPLVQNGRHYLYHADLDRVLIYSTDAALKIGIDVALEI